MSELSADSSGDIVARAGRYYRNARYLICAMVFCAGLWFAYDGLVRWPRELSEYERKTTAEKAAGHLPHSEFDIRLQQRLAMALIPLAPILLGVFLYRSRGVYRLSGTTLYVPGHPPVPFEAIVELDQSKWKRKGIAYVDYQLPDSEAIKRLTLDDFVYEQKPTDKIVDQLESWLNPKSEEETETAEAQADAEVSEEPEVEKPS